MRGVVTSGMAGALDFLGYRDAFDEVYGASAGGIIGAYFIAGQAEYGTTIFYRVLANPRFIDMRRLLLRGNVMNLDYLLDEVMDGAHPLDYERVLDSEVPLHIYATNVQLDHDRPVELPRATTKDELRRNFRATTLIPLVAGAPLAFADGLFCDAGIWDSIPYRFAEEDGASHILVLQSRPLNNPRPRPTVLERLVAPRYFRRVAPAALEGYLTRVDRYNEDCRRLASLSADGGRSPCILSITPGADVPAVASYETDRRRVVDGGISGFDAVYRAFLGHGAGLVEMITPMRDARRLDRKPWGED